MPTAAERRRHTIVSENGPTYVDDRHRDLNALEGKLQALREVRPRGRFEADQLNQQIHQTEASILAIRNHLGEGVVDPAVHYG